MSGRFGVPLRTLRLEAGLTQEQLAELAGLGVRTVQRLEAGRSGDMRTGTVRQIAHALADALDRDRDDVLQELLAGHRDEGSTAPSDAVFPEPPGGWPSPAGPDGAPGAGGPAVEGTGPSAAATPAPGPRGGPHAPVREPREPAAPPAPRRRPAVTLLPRADLEYAAESLARSEYGRWIREEEQRRIHDPFPLPVRWHPAPAGLLDHWDNVDGAPPGAGAQPVPLAGSLPQVAQVYRLVNSGRLVVLGRAGSGKTVLMLRFVLDYLTARTAEDPVPVVFTVGGWDPSAATLRDWLVGRLLRDHPDLAARTPGRSTLAAALVDAGWILPVLDGFDEIATGLQPAALRELNDTSLPLVLTSRTEQFAAATAGEVLRRAAGIELDDLTPDDVAHYLPRTARPAASGGRTAGPASVWDPVLDRLRARPQDPACANLAAVLRTPLMVLLARTRYSDAPGQDPADLLDTARFPTRAAVEEHLLAGFVPAVYRHHPAAAAGRRPRRCWEPDRAHHYLAQLAHQLDRPEHRDRQDLAWWRLGGALSTPARLLAIALACSTVTAVCMVAVYVVARLAVPGSPPPGLLPGVPVQSLTIGVVFALVYWSAVAFRREPFKPSRVRLRRPRRGGPGPAVPVRRVVASARSGLLAGAGFAVLQSPLLPFLPDPGYRVLIETTSPVPAALIDTLRLALVYGLAGGAALGGMAAMEAPVDVGTAATPAVLLAVNRATVVRRALFLAPAITLAVAGVLQVLQGPLAPYWLGRAHAFRPWAPLLDGAECGLVTALCYVLVATAWGQWLLFARLCLPLSGRLPWAGMAFLEDAYRRGVLRQAGAVYQFRHARLQHHLDASPPP
ncbi:helix-turn-helix domain-containing protein [Kitasatospora sp. NPDC058965]|uniref:helix-turn-helix domain-containing protein n=1 Tax=Kitasatospora sp. NPDC058965 TaxID=3346682 RepID=UPI00367ED6DC